MTVVAGDRVTASVSVRLNRARTFALFTQEIDRWWRRGPRYRHTTTPGALIAIEPRLGGRVFESWGSGSEEHLFEIGRVSQWDPPARLAFSWRNQSFTRGETTVVEVDFADHGETTMVTVTHHGWASVPADHPARHGLATAAFQQMIGRWWGDQLTALRQGAAAPAP